MTRKKIIQITALALCLIGIFVTIFLVKQIQDNRSRADDAAPQIYISPSQVKYGLGMFFPVDVYLDAKNQLVTLVDFEISYNPNVLKLEKFIPEKILDTQISSNEVLLTDKGTFDYLVIDSLNKPVTGKVKIARLLFSATTNGNSQINITRAEIGSDQTTTSQIAIAPASVEIIDPTKSSPTTPIPTVANSSGQAMLTAKVKLPGIGSDAKKGENPKPKRTTRTAKIQIYTAQNSLVKEVETSLTYTPSESTYNGLASLGDIPSEQYTLKISFDNTLVTTLPSKIPLSKNNTFTTNPVELNPGDVNGDGALSITDYNLLQSCYRKQPACTSNIAQRADFNDDNIVVGDDTDANILAREFYSKN